MTDGTLLRRTQRQVEVFRPRRRGGLAENTVPKD
jgi:hypothetical protein